MATPRLSVDDPRGWCSTWKPVGAMSSLIASGASDVTQVSVSARTTSLLSAMTSWITAALLTTERARCTSKHNWHYRISAILDFRGPIMGSLKSPCRPTTSYRSSIHTIALNFLVFEKIAFLQFGDRQTNRWTCPMHEAALAVSLSRAAA